MVSGPTSIGSLPVVNYKPDPGEPAVRLSAKQPQTAILVHSQEQRNETRLRNRALAEGEDILYSNKTFNLNVGQVSPVFSSGLTTVVTRPDANGFLPDFAPAITPSQQKAQEEEQTPAEELQAQEEEAENPLTPGMDSLAAAQEPSEEDLQEEDQQLENEDSRLERNLTQAVLEQNRALVNGNPVQFEAARREENQSVREMDEVEKDQRENEIDKLQAQLREFQQDTEDVLNQNAQAAMGILDVMFGLNRDSNPFSTPGRAAA